MSAQKHTFLFASLSSKHPNTTRKIHIRRLYDILQLSIQRNDFVRARRAWAILARCKEMNWTSLWTTGLQILAETEEDKRVSIDYLRTMMLQYPDDRESILKELIFYLLLNNRHTEALDELDLYLPSFPYHDNPVFHIYAALIRLYLAQSEQQVKYDPIMLQGARAHVERAQELDPDDVFTTSLLQRIELLGKGKVDADEDSEDELMLKGDDNEHHRKRFRS